MLSSNITPVYAKQNLSANRRAFFVVSSFLGCLLLIPVAAPRAASLEDAPHELAMKVCTAGRKQPVNVRWHESANSSGYWSDARKKSFLDQISACGLEPTENPEVAILRVSAELTPSRVLLIAETSDSSAGRQIRMVEVPRILPLSSQDNSSAPHLTGELLWQQEHAISSAMAWQDPASQERLLFLLSDDSFVRLRFESGAWRLTDSAALPPLSRRSRAHEGGFAYAITGHPFEFLWDGKVCAFSPTEALLFSCAAQTLVGKPLLLSSKCEPLPRHLGTSNGDFTQPDQILLGAPTRDAAPRSAREGDASALDVPGPVLSLSSGENGMAAFAVVRNLATGNYEVYRVTAACGD